MHGVNTMHSWSHPLTSCYFSSLSFHYHIGVAKVSETITLMFEDELKLITETRRVMAEILLLPISQLAYHAFHLSCDVAKSSLKILQYRYFTSTSEKHAIPRCGRY